MHAEQLLHRSPGGIGRYTAQLLTALPAVGPGCEVLPFTARHPPDRIEAALAAAGVPETVRAAVARQPLPAGVLYRTWNGLGRPHLRGLDRATLVHAPSAVVPPASGRPLVVTIHDAAPERCPDAFTAADRRFHRLGVAAAARRADLVITVSQAAADDLAVSSPIPSERIRVVPNGIDPPPPADDIDADRRILAGLGLASAPFVLWVGSLEPRKGVGTLVAAMATLRGRGRHPDVVTVLAGYEGWLGGGLIADSDRAVLGDSLRQLGPVRETELWTLYRHAEVFAFPSRYEGFGLPVVEAMSQGRPVVASDIPALREVAGGAARLVAPADPAAWADAIGGLLDDEAERGSLGRAGVERSRSFTVGAMASATYRLYQALGS